MKQITRPVLIFSVSRSLLAAAFFFALSSASYAQETPARGTQKPTVLILATYHLHNPGRDVLNVQWDNVLTEKRQKEIREFADLLKRFKPTKIALEAPFGSAKLGEHYDRYLRGEYQLTANEIDQIGYRLAKDLKHSKVYGVDAPGAFDIGRVFAFAAANNQQHIVDKTFEIAKRQVAETNEMVNTANVADIYRKTNDQRNIDETHQAYLAMARIGKSEEYPGVDLLTDWYKRNLKIFSNIARITDSSSDRILVLIGAGHAKLLQQFIEDSGQFDLERANIYL